jgi:hypothetical protein
MHVETAFFTPDQDSNMPKVLGALGRGFDMSLWM